MEQEYQYMVCTGCSTFNHAPYIVDAMNGFAMQETTFPVCYLITDDASTDGEPEIIKQYLAEHFHSPYRTEETDDYHLICAVHKTNPNCTFIVFLLKYNHYSIKKSKLPYQAEWRDNAKYIAICEGDDYWIHPKKLQIQVNILESNSDYSLCFHCAYEISDSEKNSRKIFSLIEDKLYSEIEIFRNFIIPTASAVMRKDVKDSSFLAVMLSDTRMNVGDLPLWMACCRCGKVRGLSLVMSVYRRHSDGWTFINKDKKGLYQSAQRWLVFYELYTGEIHEEAKRKYVSHMVGASLIHGLDVKIFLKSFKAFPKETLQVLLSRLKSYIIKHFCL